MSTIKRTPVELADIVEESNLILEVKCIEPYTEEVIIKSDPPIKPFIKKGFVFNVISIIKNTAMIEVPKTIRVPKEDWRRSLSQHKEKYANGPRKSFGVKQYMTEVSSMKNAEILFLHYFQHMYDLEVQGAFESAAAREKVDMLVAAG